MSGAAGLAGAGAGRAAASTAPRDTAAPCPKAMAQMDALDWALLNAAQHHFPLDDRPFAALAQRLREAPEGSWAVDEDTVLQRLQALQQAGVIGRVGPVFAPRRAGVSTLAALKVAPADCDAVAARLNAWPEVNHNYRREHAYSLWFVVTAADPWHLQRVLGELRAAAGGVPLLDLPLVKAHHIDLGFPVAPPDAGAEAALTQRSRGHPQAAQPTGPHPVADAPRPGFDRGCGAALQPKPEAAAPQPALPDDERPLVAAIQHGLPLVPEPYAAVAQQLGAAWPTARVQQTLARWLHQGIVKRLGLVVRHHELGYVHNAMVVWALPENAVDACGEWLGEAAGVTLCYQRPRRLPDWPYNLFCMLHGRQRAAVEARVAELAAGLAHQQGWAQPPEHALLFSTHRYLQRGARYAEF